MMCVGTQDTVGIREGVSACTFTSLIFLTLIYMWICEICFKDSSPPVVFCGGGVFFFLECLFSHP